MLESIILGIVQGLTEFLPVSSSAHLIILPWFFKWDGIINSLSFDVALHFGTLLALLFYFRNDWVELLKSLSQKEGLAWKIIAGTMPAVIAGFFLHDFFEHSVRNPYLIAATLSLVSVLMLISEKGYDNYSRRSMESVTFGNALLIGFAQATALMPGVSRSGITIVAGLMLNLRREDAARFSFLLATPAVAGASLLEAKNLAGTGAIEIDIFMTGALFSAATGFFAVKYLILFFKNYSLRPFAYYRFLLSFAIILAIWTRLAG
ncbi:MAG: undecaprenyl-diphosphate phosphatase [Nitrospirae bacterium]|nr:undecaprenyl-diphosphate phosphatase [Nitrospirota bacterium]